MEATVTYVTPVTRVTSHFERGGLNILPLVVVGARKDARLHDIHPHGFALYLLYTSETIVAGDQHPTVSKHAGNKLRVVATSNFGLPSFGWDQPFAMLTFSLVPTGALVNGTLGRFVGRFEPGIPMLFDKQPHLRDGPLDFTSLRATPGLEPVAETLACGFHGCALLPVNHTKFARQLACRCDKCKMIADP